MPTFATPEPIRATVELDIGDVRLTAGDRGDTDVQVRPSEETNDKDVTAADQTRVEYTDGRLLVKAPRRWRVLGPARDGGSVDVTVELPAGSHVQGSGGVAAFRGEGRLGECRIHTGVGDIQLDRTGPLDAVTTGAIAVNQVAGDAEARTGTGRISLGRVAGAAGVRNSGGDTWIGDVIGDLKCKSAYGDIIIDTARSGVTANSSKGDIRIGSVTRGFTSVTTAIGGIELGVHADTAAHLDVHTKFGRVHNELDATEDPAPSEDTVEVRARTSLGDIVIHRSSTSPTPPEEVPGNSSET